MTTSLQRVELESGRVLTFVADDQAETTDDAPRVYLGSQTDLVAAGAESHYITQPTVSIAGVDFWLSPERAAELARRLMIAAVNVRARCWCGHQWWEHYQGYSCDHTGDTPPDEPAHPAVCTCALFQTVQDTPR